MGDADLAALLRTKGIRDERVLAAIGSISRANFVPEEARDDATVDTALPIGHGQTISQPYVVAYMTEALELLPGERVLEVGTGSGYQTAVLARLGVEVFSVEVVPELAQSARERLEHLGLPNLRLRCADGWAGWPEAAPFDAVLLTAAPSHVPVTLLGQLRPGGRLVGPVGASALDQYLIRLDKRADGSFERRTLLPVQFVPMVGGEANFA
jgi:protein-L-isoaspartate(D-aspartate) O-methyltransferase